MEFACPLSISPSALSALDLLAAAASTACKSRAALQVENLALRHQLGVLAALDELPKLTSADRLLWAWLCEVWNDWRSALVIVKPETVISWRRQGFRLFWTWKVWHGHPGRPAIPKDVRELIGRMSRENPLWGAPRIHSELLKLGIDISQISSPSTCSDHGNRSHKTWRTFPGESCQDPGVSRRLHGTDGSVPVCVLVLAHDRRRDRFRRYGPPHGGVDCPATPRRISVGHRARLSGAGSRSHLRRRIHGAGRGYGHPGSPLGPAISLAASVHRRTSRHPPPRGAATRAPAGTRSRRGDTASWRSAPTVPAARSLNLAVLAPIPIQGELCQVSLSDSTRPLSMANRSVEL